MSETQRRSILEAAAKDRELVGQVPAVVAAGFGVLPLRRLGDVLTVACLPRANRRALRVLRDVLGLEIVATPFEERSLHEAIHAAYFAADETVNFPTFVDAGFLEDPRSAAALREEKVERVGDVALALAPELVSLITLGYRSTLRNLDAPPPGSALPDPRRTKLELGELDVAWRREGQVVHAYAEGGLPAGARALVTEYRTSDYRHVPGGCVSEHSVRARLLTALPHVVHPTEVQLTRIEADGAIALHLYDQTGHVAPGERRRFRVSYHFLSYGSRLHRSIDVDVHEVGTVARARLDVHNCSAPWGASELGRWLGVTGPPPQE